MYTFLLCQSPEIYVCYVDIASRFIDLSGANTCRLDISLILGT